MIINNTNEMNEHFRSCFPEEGCGFIVGRWFVEQKNIAEDKKNDFRISSKGYLKYNQKIKAVVHSHTHTKASPYDKRTPSMADMTGQKATCVPWGIANTEGENVSPLLWFGLDKPAPVLAREFVHNVYDCLTLACDYMKLEFNIDVPTFPRPMDWDEMNKFMITDGIEEGGFNRLSKETELKDLQKGDFILFQIQGNFLNHVGVYIGEGKFYHHLMGRLSKEDTLMKWQKNIVMYLRHKTL